MTDKRYENHYNMNNNDYQYTIKYIMIKRLTKNTTILANCIHSDCIVLSIKQAATNKKHQDPTLISTSSPI